MGDAASDPAIELLDFYTPFIVRMLVAAGAFEAFGREARTPADVAAAADVDAETLRRMVRALASRGVFEEAGDGQYRLTELGRRFLRDEPRSVAGLANFKPWELHAWAAGDHTLRTGEPSFPEYFTVGFWDWLVAHPEQSARFNEDMRRRTTGLLDGGLALHDWPEEGTVVDIGGGNGLLLERVLRERPGVRGVVFDQPRVVAEAEAHFKAAGVADRVEVVGGGFFVEVPAGGDVYVMASVLHDWHDDQSVRILQTIRRAMKPTSRLVLFEAVLKPGTEPDLFKMIDLHMLMLFGAKERTRDDWETLLSRAGFTLERVIPTPGLSWIESSPAE
jgi:SAM-dependent methyltransferase/predicted transcriptional regulator